ncbi:restriction endonuclease [Pseudomonas cichorii]|uniref:Restriction endonuclease type IV Mrr domain-containing protein n=2 Tax=Pseudomonas cichorii TaxID=36746 RepID=A0ABQ1DUS6_PSECI|nr:restriction endonuclease [Pseudomonas cichorii]QVE17879.1 restriction endonuclease [Pseudomonas cichorii]GFM94739.1 hypothetical protein PSCICP_47110 [Pseudomonas cichorii]
MPARTNHYQKLVKIINKELASADAKLTESAMLYDYEGKCEREVDILIESVISGCEIKIAVECTELSKPVGIRALESFKEKHRKLGINKTVVVSHSGFSKPAKEYAIANHIKTLTFNAARSENWSKHFAPLKKLAMYGRSYKLAQLAIDCSAELANSGFQFGLDTKVIINGALMDVGSFASKVWSESNVAQSHFKELRENELGGAQEPWAEITVELGKNHTFEDRNGARIQPDKLHIRMNYSSNYRELNPKPVEYDGKQYLAGGFFDKKKSEFAHFALTESSGQINGSMEFSSNLIPD